MILLRVFLLISALAYFVFAVRFIGRRNPLSVLFALGCLAIFVYSLGYSFELGSKSLEEILFWLKFEYFGLSFVPLFWFLFAYRFVMGKRTSMLISVALISVSVLTLFFSATNDYLHFYYKDVSYLYVDGSLIAQLAKGPWYYVFIVYSLALIVGTIVLFFLQWRRSKQGMSSPSGKLFVGALCVILFQGVYLVGLSPYGIDLTAFGFLPGIFLAGLIVLRQDFLRADGLVKDVVFGGISEGILVVDTEGRISDFNRMGSKVFPWLTSEIIGSNLYKFQEGATLAACAATGRPYVKEGEGKARNRFYEVKAEKLKDGGKVVGKVILFKDVTAIRKVIKRLYRLANYDTLTKVFNRRRFFDDAEKEVSRVKRYGGFMALLMLDLDDFKTLNDEHGHQAGDLVLAEVGGILKRRTRASDIVGRYGGEEFSVVLVAADEAKASIVAEDIRKSIEELRVKSGEKVLSITISIGIAASDDSLGDLSLEQLLAVADRALYRAKREGRNRVCSGPAPMTPPQLYQ